MTRHSGSRNHIHASSTPHAIHTTNRRNGSRPSRHQSIHIGRLSLLRGGPTNLSPRAADLRTVEVPQGLVRVASDALQVGFALAIGVGPRQLRGDRRQAGLHGRECLVAARAELSECCGESSDEAHAPVWRES